MHVRKEWSIAGILQLIAIFLATEVQTLAQVRTDEAKYLLNIPYPHPPLLRWVMSLTEALPFQEVFWRLLLATLLVQAVWLIWDMTRSMHLEDRIMVCAGWILSSAVLTQAGSIMMAPVTALQALVFVWLMTRPELVKKYPAGIALFWLASLFTAYQAVLFAPLAWTVLRRGGQSRMKSALFVMGPMALLALYTLTSPLVLGAFLLKGNGDVRIATRMHDLLGLWAVGGAVIASAVGTWGILKSKNLGLMGSLVLVCAYLLLPPAHPYYAILFTPLFVAGLFHLFHGRKHPHAFPMLACLLFATALVTWFARPETVPGPARSVMQAVDASSGSGVILIYGSFGHEWQYESHTVIRRYTPESVKDAKAIVCLETCDPPFNTSGWKRVAGVEVETWVRK